MVFKVCKQTLSLDKGCTTNTWIQEKVSIQMRANDAMFGEEIICSFYMNTWFFSLIINRKVCCMYLWISFYLQWCISCTHNLQGMNIVKCTSFLFRFCMNLFLFDVLMMLEIHVIKSLQTIWLVSSKWNHTIHWRFSYSSSWILRS